MKVVQMEALDFRYLLLEYYKKLHLKEDEVMVIFMIDHLLGQKNKLITADLLSIKMNLKIEDIDKILVRLLEKNIIEYSQTKVMKTSLKPLREKVYSCFEEAMKKEQETTSDKNKAAFLQNIYQVFEKEFQRSLSPVEFSMIQEWINDNFTDEQILSALKELKAKGRKPTLKAIDKILLSYRAREDIDKTGYSAIGDDWDKDIEQTIAIAKAKWVDDD